jgi:tRNA A58 N-methylase Trm61
VSRRWKWRLVAYSVLAAVLAGGSWWAFKWAENRTPGEPDVVFRETPQDAVDKMLDMARVGPDDVVYDLGCGDARFLITAAKKHGCRGIGYEIQPHVAALARQKVAEAGVGHLVEVREGDIFDRSVDLRPATVLTLFLLPELNVKLIPKIKTMRPGCRVVSYLFDMEGVRPKEEVVYRMPNRGWECRLYLWETPLEVTN